MGYATQYTLKWERLGSCSLSQEQLDDLISSTIQARKEQTDDEFFYGVDGHGETLDSCKWYDHAEDLKKFSQEFPDVLFTLHGKGEESEDIWKKYFVNGKVQFSPAIITFAEFNPNQLR